jgi:biopolymer transport protein ExbD
MFGERKKIHAEAGEGVQLSMVVTPMLDMAFQLLAFFVMVYNPSPLETHLAGKLLPFSKLQTAGPPAKDKEPMEKKDDTPPVDKDPEVKDNLRIILRAVPANQEQAGRKDGEPTEIRLKRPDVAEPETIADINVTFEKGLKLLAAELQRIREGPNGADVNLSIDPDANLRYDYFIQVYDICMASKFKEIGYNAPLKAT